MILHSFQIIDHLTFLNSNLTAHLIKNCVDVVKFKSFLNKDSQTKKFIFHIFFNKTSGGKKSHKFII